MKGNMKCCTTYLETGEKQKCCGCTACEVVCPVHAIIMDVDNEGFVYPKINAEACIGCGRCRNICPMEKPQIDKPIQVYAAYNTDTTILLASSSGGAFRALADEILFRGGVVCGAIMEDNRVFHVISDEPQIVSKMSGSKYVQSDLGTVLSELKRVLQTRRDVLFTGTPCQCAAVKKLFSRSQHLYTMDFVCHGVPSPAVFRDYITYLEKKEKQKVTYQAFRYKDSSKMGKYEIYQTESGKIRCKPFYDSFYLSGFEMAVFTRQSCNVCPYSTTQRGSDFTVCDYWGVEKYHADLDVRKGVSGLMVNSARGQKLLKMVQGRSLKCIPTEIEYLSKENSNLRMSTPKNPQRDAFYQAREKLDFSDLTKEYMEFPGSWKWRIKDMIPYQIKCTVKKLLKNRG